MDTYFGTPGALRHAWQQGHFQLLVSSPTAAELLRALAYPKFELSSAEQEELLADYLRWCETVSHSQTATHNPTS